MAPGSFLFSILTLLYGLNSTPLLALLLCVAMGPAYQIRDVAQQTSFQSSIDHALLPQVYASRGILLSTISASSIALVGFVSDQFGIKMVYILASILIFLSAILSFTLNHKAERNSSVSSTL
jgi:4-hydroxybenzoate polyprenyltransferase